MKKRYMYLHALLFFMMCTGLIGAQEPVPFADFENDDNGWWAEEHAYDLMWTDEAAGMGSTGAIMTGIDPNLPADDSPESKITGYLPGDVNIGDYEYISFYYKCDSEAYTGSTMFLMPMAEGSAAGGGVSHAGTMLGDGEWHYEEYHVSEFVNWWGGWSWEDTAMLTIGVFETSERGPCIMWYDHIMLFNEPGGGMLVSNEGPPEVMYTEPADGEMAADVETITIVFNREVENVKADDLQVLGHPAVEVATEDNRRYVFSGFPPPEFPTMTEPGEATVPVELQAGSIQSLDGQPFDGYAFSYDTFVHVALPPTAFADFETDANGWVAEEHAFDLQWVTDDTAGETSAGAIKTGIDPTLPADDSPESKVRGELPEGVNMGGYEYISFYYKCDNPDYTGGTMFIMPMTEGFSDGAGASHDETMLGDGQWHYEEYHRSEFDNWWGNWNWADTQILVIGVWETMDRGLCNIWYDHVMLFNNPGEGRIDYVNVENWSLY